MSKVFIIGPAYPLRGGPAQFNENLCAELNKAGHDAQIISYSLQYPNFLFPGSTQYETSGKAPDGIKIHTLINTVNPFNWLKVAGFIKKEKPDFILFRYWLPFFGPCLGTIGRLVRSKTTVLALTDNIIPHEKRFGDKPFTNYFVNSCDGFIAMSKTVLNDISKFTTNQNKAYSPHPMYETYGASVSMEEARKKLNLNSSDKIILFFGLIRHYKGLDILMEAMANSEIKKQNIKLLIAGEFYEDKQPYLDLIQKHQLQDQILLHDKFIANDDVRYYFCASNLVAQTYRNATNSGVTMVGYYYEKPMLVTNVGGLAEIVPNEKCGYVVETEIPEISEKIITYFSQNKEEAFTQNVRIEKKKYEWTEFIGVLVNLYQTSRNSP
jgi:glycosyltransferase involved in cell wall biosynthesis